MKITEVLTEKTIQLQLDASNKGEAIEKMAKLIEGEGNVTDLQQFVADVKKREESGSTGIGFGVAIPHGKSSGISKPSLAFVKFTQPVDWEALDGKEVNMAFLIGVPAEQAGNEHLQILTTLARKLIHESFRNDLLNASSAAEVLKVLDF